MNLLVYKNHKTELLGVNFPDLNKPRRSPALSCVYIREAASSDKIEFSRNDDCFGILIGALIVAFMDLNESQIISVEKRATNHDFLFGLFKTKSTEYLIRVIQDGFQPNDILTAAIYESIIKLRPLNGEPLVSIESVISLTFNRLGDSAYEIVSKILQSLSIDYSKKDRDIMTDFMSAPHYEYKLDHSQMLELKKLNGLEVCRQILVSQGEFVNHLKNQVREQEQIRAVSTD